MSSRQAARRSGPSWGRIGLHARRPPVKVHKASPHKRPKSKRSAKKREGRLSPESRRMRALLIGACAFALLVLVTSMPVSALLTQHSQISQTAVQLRRLEAQNRTLKQETTELSNPSIVADIARRDYGLVSPGSQAYEILPVPGSSASAAQTSGHVPLDEPPVVPGSARSQALLGAGALAPITAGAASRTSSANDSSGGASTTGGRGGGELTPKGGFWTRVADTLAFWR